MFHAFQLPLPFDFKRMRINLKTKKKHMFLNKKKNCFRTIICLRILRLPVKRKRLKSSDYGYIPEEFKNFWY